MTPVDKLLPMPSQTRVTGRNPNITIWLFAGIPWDNTYTNVRLFSSQQDAFNNILGNFSNLELENCEYVDYGSMVVDVPVQEINAKKFNYMIIRDDTTGLTNYEFCFILGTKRRGRNATTITFEHDTFQNNIYQCTLSTTFIERAHVTKANDVAGNYTKDEGLEFGDYISADKLPFSVPDYTDPDYGDWSIVIATTFDEAGKAVVGDMTQGVYGGINYFAYDTATGANNFINAAVSHNLLEGIVQIFMLPSKWVDISDVQYQDITVPKIAGKIDGYTPKNQKLFVYPYVQLYINNNCGASASLKQEYFPGGSMKFKAGVPLTCNPKLYLFAERYKGINLNAIDTVNFSSFPNCAVAIDSYKAWLAQTGASQFTQAVAETAETHGFSISGAVQDAIAAITANVVGGTGGGSLLGTAANALRKTSTTYIQPPTAVGTMGGDGLYQVNLCRIDMFRMTIRAEWAKKIDDYFSMYGYNISEFGDIMYYMNTRSRFNYIKTCNCNIIGGTCEAGELAKLRSIFDSGVTVWHINRVGDYTGGENI